MISITPREWLNAIHKMDQVALDDFELSPAPECDQVGFAEDRYCNRVSRVYGVGESCEIGVQITKELIDDCILGIGELTRHYLAKQFDWAKERVNGRRITGSLRPHVSKENHTTKPLLKGL